MNSETLVLNDNLCVTPLQYFGAHGCQPIPGFEILSELGCGGMGVVWMARQIALDRIVALKMIVDGVQLHESDRMRFLAEAEAVAAIKHPNVVQVYEFGQTNATPYFAMEYVDGGSLAHALFSHGPLAPVTAAKLIANVARGVQAAHNVGVVHRDLKPANILLALPDGDSRESNVETRKTTAAWSSSPRPDLSLVQPKISDFGIAKRTRGVELTLPGMVIGTPAYMAPEQAIGNAKFVGPGADVYALGVILYECLTGTTPFTGADATTLLMQVVRDDAPSVKTVNVAVPRDLDLIVSKCLAKAPHERYPSAAALADDLDRFAQDEPVSVRPPGRLERAVKWMRKYPGWAAAAAAAVVAAGLLIFAGGLLAMWRQADDARARAEGAFSQADSARGEAERQSDRAAAARREAEAARSAALIALDREKLARENEARTLQELSMEKASHDTDLAYREYDANNIPQAKKYLNGCPQNQRPWEWHYLNRLCEREAAVIDSGAAEVKAAAFSSDDGTLITASGLDVRLWDPHTLARHKSIPGQCSALALSGNGKRLVAVRGGETIVLECPGGRRLGKFQGNAATVACNRDGTQVLVCHTTATLWRPESAKKDQLPTEELIVCCGTLTHDGAVIAVGGQPTGTKYSAGVVKVWRAGRDPQVIPVHPESIVRNIAVAADGSLVAAGCDDGVIMVVDVATGARVVRLRGHGSMISGLAFDSAGKRLASVSTDRTARVWNVETGVQTSLFKGHSMAVMGVAVAPDGGRIATASFDGSVRLWTLDRLPDRVRLAGLTPARGPHAVGEFLPPQSISSAAVSNDGERIAITRSNASVEVFDARSGALLWKQGDLGSTLHSLRITPDGRGLLGVTAQGEFRAWDLASGAARTPPERLAVKNLASLSGDHGRALLVDAKTRSVSVLDARTGDAIAATEPHYAPYAPPVISPDGRLIVTAGVDRKAILWDADTGRKLLELTGHYGYIYAAAISPDGSRIATAAEDGWMKLWDAKTGRAVLSLRLGAEIRAVAWSADGSKLIAVDDRGVGHIHEG